MAGIAINTVAVDDRGDGLDALAKIVEEAGSIRHQQQDRLDNCRLWSKATGPTWGRSHGHRQRTDLRCAGSYLRFGRSAVGVRLGNALRPTPRRRRRLRVGHACRGCECRLHLFPGTFHGSVAIQDAAISKREQIEAIAVLRQALAL
jgi:hypothetical protein